MRKRRYKSVLQYIDKECSLETKETPVKIGNKYEMAEETAKKILALRGPTSFKLSMITDILIDYTNK